MRELKTKYLLLSAVISEAQQQDGLTSGQMLFLAFDTLFSNVDSALEEMQCAYKLVDVPEEWLGVDTVSQGKNLVDLHSDPEYADLNSLGAFLCKLLVLKEFYSLCTRSMLSFKADVNVLGQTIPDGDELARPVKVFMTEFFRRCLVGYGTLSLSIVLCDLVNNTEPKLLANLPSAKAEKKLSVVELSSAYLERKLSVPGLDDARLRLSAELNNLFALVRRVEMARFLEQNIEALNASQQITHMQINSLQWFHESELPAVDPAQALARGVPSRSGFMSDLSSLVKMSLVIHKQLGDVQAKYQELHESVESRFKWACGANPEMKAVYDNYATAFVNEMEAYRGLGVLFKAVAGSTNTILHHEALRTQTREAINADGNFMALMGECQQSASLRETQTTTLNEEELKLFALCPPKDAINVDWIRQTVATISEEVTKTKAKMKVESGKMAEVQKTLLESSNTIRSDITTHQKLMADAGNLLRTISKSEDYDIPEVTAYLGLYKEFSDLISTLVRDLTLDDHSSETMQNLIGVADRAKEVIGPIYENLVGFTSVLTEENLEQYKKKDENNEQNNGNNTSKDEKKSANEEKNAFALNVLKRVRTKLEGREPDALKRASVAEQVDFVIREATDPDNLALMYEGWTAWI